MPGASPAPVRAPSPRPPSSCPSPSTASFSRFYEEQQLSKDEAVQRLAEQLEEQLARDCPFRPKINPYPSGRRPEGDQRDPFTRLSRDKADTYRQLEEERAKLKEKELEECSFRPRTNSSFSSTRVTKAGHTSYLHNDATERQLLLQRKKEQEEEERKDWFRPKINSMSRATVEAEPRPPIHERLDEMQRQKQRLVHALRMQEREKEAATFQPHINPTSQEIVHLQQQSAASTADSNSCSQYEEQVMQQSKTRARLQEEAQRRLSLECTFRPKLSHKTADIVQQHAAFRASDFYERQMLFARRSKGKLNAAAQKAAAEADAPFEPALSSTSVLLTQAKRDAESTEEKMARLAVHDKAKVEELRKSAHEQYYGQFSFQPKLNKVSQALARTSEGTNIARAKTGHVTEELRQELEEEFQKNCTFKPTILSARGREGLSGSVLSGGPDPVERERRLAEARREKQYEELKDCTFQPRRKKKVPDFARQQVEVPGLAKYLDRRMQAQQQDEERRAREEQAFKVRAAIKPGHRYTVPQPFNLHNKYHSVDRKEKAEAQLKAKTEQTCTFAPHTNAKAAYEILRKYILQDDPESDDEAYGHNPWMAEPGLEVVDLEAPEQTPAWPPYDP